MRINETTHFDQDGFSGDVYVSDENKKGFNALRVSVHGKHPEKIMLEAKRIYLVISGEGLFTIDDVVHQAVRDDLYVIEPGSKYKYEGQMELFEFNVSPANIFK